MGEATVKRQKNQKPQKPSCTEEFLDLLRLGLSSSTYLNYFSNKTTSVGGKDHTLQVAVQSQKIESNLRALQNFNYAAIFTCASETF